MWFGKLEVTELKMLRFFLFGVTMKDMIRNEYIRGPFQVECFGDKLTNNVKLVAEQRCAVIFTYVTYLCIWAY